MATLIQLRHSPDRDTRQRGHSPNGDTRQMGTRRPRRVETPGRSEGAAAPFTCTPAPVCHSERSEESTWSFAACSRGKAHTGFFASLRMTTAGQLPRFAPSALPRCRDHSRLDPHFLATVCAPSRNHVRTFVQPCPHMGSTLSGPSLEAVRTLSRRCSHFVPTVFARGLDVVRTVARVRPQQKSRGQNGAGLF